MRLRMLAITSGLLVAGLARCAWAAPPGLSEFVDHPCTEEHPTRPCTREPMFSGFSLEFDEDWFQAVGPTSDRNYTLGVGFELPGRWVRATHLDRPGGWLDELTGVAAVRDDWLLHGGGVAHSAGLHISAFTPDRLEDPEAENGDRPYASVAAITTRRLSVDPTDREAIQSEFAVGVLGVPGAAKGIQTAIHIFGREHNLFQRPNPQGWSHQISNGGEPTVLYSVTGWKKVSPEWLHHVDLALNAEGTAGWYTGAAGGALVRLGCIASRPWATPVTPLGDVSKVESQVASAGTGTSDGSGGDAPGPTLRHTAELYLYGSAKGRLVIFNEMLEGGFRDSDVRIALRDVSPLIAEVEVGATLRVCSFRVSYAALSYHTPEFHVLGGDPPRVHAWGGIYLAYEPMSE